MSSFSRLRRAACLLGLIVVATAACADDVLDRSLEGDGIRLVDTGGGGEYALANCLAADGKHCW